MAVNERFIKMFNAIIYFTWPVLLVIAGWTFNSITDQQNRLTKIESTDYTITESQKDKAEIVEKINMVDRKFIYFEAATTQYLKNIEEILKDIRTDLKRE